MIHKSTKRILEKLQEEYRQLGVDLGLAEILRLREKAYQDYFKKAHGLHVAHDVYVKSCSVCAERAKLKVIARITGVKNADAE
jgi:hypothetical protein